MSRFILPLLISTVAGCVATPFASLPKTSMQLHFDAAAMRAEVLKYLSVGMPIENAKRILEDSGFQCPSFAFGGASSLQYRAIYQTHGFVADEIWVAMDYESGVVTDIKVDCISVGP